LRNFFIFINLDDFLAEVKGVGFHLYSNIKPHYCTLVIREPLYKGGTQPGFGMTRTWYESYDIQGRVVQVHPKRPKDLGHIQIDPQTGKEINRRP
jgi:hypothetical protein